MTMEVDDKGTILVVDDNALNVELLKDALENMGQNVVTAYNGKAAMEIVQKMLPDLILLDIMMPDISGYTVLEKLKADTVTADIPVIFISALATTQYMVRWFKYGTDDYITKPFKIEEVKARISASLRIKRLQNSLKKERDKFRAIFRYSADGIALLGSQMEVLSANPIFADWFGMTLSEEGQPTGLISFFHLLGCQCAYNQLCPLHTAAVTLVASQAESTENESCLLESATIPAPGGLVRYLSIHCGKVRSSEGQEDAFVVVVRDITAAKELEQSKETFVATLTHDLKTPIRAEYQALELLREGTFGTLSEEQSDIVKEIIQSNRYMSRLVESLLTTYLYEAGKADLKLELVNINHLIQMDVYGPLATLSSEKGQSLRLDLDPEPPWVQADSIEIRRVLNNLVQNAISFTPPEGTITISTRHDETCLWVSVQDNGSGIAQEDQEGLFERYTSKAKQFKQVGTGLGLYLSRMIVESHGGHIGVESEPERGSTFFFSLPIL